MKIRGKLLVVLVAIAGASSVLTMVGSQRLLRAAVRDRLVERLTAETALLGDWIRAEGPRLDPRALVDRGSRHIGARITLIRADGSVLADSAFPDERVGGLENHRGRPEVRQAAARGTGHAFRRSASTGGRYLYLARAVEGGGPVRFVGIALPAAEVERFEAQYGWLLFLVSAGSLLLLTSAAYLLVGRLTRPIERMARAAERSAAGNLHLDVPYEGRDEVGMLAVSVNRMRATLLGKIHELEEERRLLASVVAGIREGLLVVGPDRRVRLANDAFLQIFGLPFEPAGRLVAEVIRDPTVIRDLDAALQDRLTVRETVVHAADSGRVFELHVTPLEPRGREQDGGALVLFFDVSRLEALENVRREFVADVSHELRTPLTSIKAFVETLLEGGVDDRETALRFLAIVRNHADRMNALIDDLTDLSLIETGSVTLDVRTIDAAEIVGEVIAQLGPKQAKLGVSVRSEVPSPFPIRADRRRLEQVLLNVVDNAIKFNRPGGSVRVEAMIREGAPVLVVEDTGVGVPSDSLEKVFHRFYRVDKARSKQAGGTGLGLSIVKHLMRLHGGQVRLESEFGQGARVVLEFPAPGATRDPKA